MKTTNSKIAGVVLAAVLATVTSEIAPGSGYGPMEAQVSPPTTTIPTDFRQSASTPVGEGRACVVGQVVDEDWTHSYPYAYLIEATSERVHWIKKLPVPEEVFGGRATHCLRSGDFLYVLLQLDTYASAALNQGMVHVVKLGLKDGSKFGDTLVTVSAAERSYSAWVWGDDDFRQVGDKLIVAGRYRYVDGTDDLPFSAAVGM